VRIRGWSNLLLLLHFVQENVGMKEYYLPLMSHMTQLLLASDNRGDMQKLPRIYPR